LVAGNIVPVQGERSAVGHPTQGRVVNTALKFARIGWLKKHALMVHAAVAALDAFAFDMFRHML
jgi:hypothetical protein